MIHPNVTRSQSTYERRPVCSLRPHTSRRRNARSTLLGASSGHNAPTTSSGHQPIVVLPVHRELDVAGVTMHIEQVTPFGEPFFAPHTVRLGMDFDQKTRAVS